ncbi:MAG: cyclic nucleotide-binding domain-containing protein [Desulfobacterales bacterium]|jgi:CRP-like cAMP-binding protein
MQISSCYLFQGLSESQLNHLRAIGGEVPLKAGQWLYREGDAAGQMYVLKDGAVELLTTVDEVELPITIVRKPGNCFGTSTLVPPHQYSLSARCAEDGTLLSIKKADLEQLIEADAELGHAILVNLAKHFLDRLKETRQELKIHFKTIFKSMHH